MTRQSKPILLITGMSGAGKSTVLKTLGDLGWEIVDNLPLLLLDRLLDTPRAQGQMDDSTPLAIGIGSQTRDFDAIASSGVSAICAIGTVWKSGRCSSTVRG
jgi:UPF0042 nucleotide-binding protein